MKKLHYYYLQVSDVLVFILNVCPIIPYIIHTEQTVVKYSIDLLKCP